MMDCMLRRDYDAGDVIARDGRHEECFNHCLAGVSMSIARDDDDGKYYPIGRAELVADPEGNKYTFAVYHFDIPDWPQITCMERDSLIELLDDIREDCLLNRKGNFAIEQIRLTPEDYTRVLECAVRLYARFRDIY